MQRLSYIALVSFILILIACGSTPVAKQKKSTLQDSGFHFNSLTAKQKQYYAQQIQPLYEKYLLKTGFNGSILVAKNGEIVYEDYHGYINYKTKESLTTYTPVHLASISKTFTAMTVLRLMEQGKVQLDDDIRQYLPNFPYYNITVKQLLCHRSGLPNYVHFMEATTYTTVKKKNKKGKTVTVSVPVKNTFAPKGFVTNDDVLQYMIKHHPAIEASPNKVFKYCNTNYVLLALIVEKVTSTPFPQFMKDSVFTPLGMTNTYIFNIKDTDNYIPSYLSNWSPVKMQQLDCVYGDKNVYSTVKDMLQWDKALYLHTFISEKSLQLAFTPYSHEKNTEHNYGLGWRMLLNPTDTVIYHNGWWHGNNTVFTRLIRDTATLIILGNKYNRNIYKAKEMTSAFTGIIDTTKLVE
jgi:CubicO group peptidase (beta-lactamase class C family)